MKFNFSYHLSMKPNNTALNTISYIRLSNITESRGGCLTNITTLSGMWVIWFTSDGGIFFRRFISHFFRNKMAETVRTRRLLINERVVFITIWVCSINFLTFITFNFMCILRWLGSRYKISRNILRFNFSFRYQSIFFSL